MDLEQTFRDILEVQMVALNEGAKLERATNPTATALRAVIAAYDKALADEEAKLPTVLHLALEAARRWA